MRELLDKFYKNEEGKQSQYRIFFIAEERDYRLGIKKIEMNEYTKSEKIQSFKPPLVNSSLVNLIKIKPNVISEKILNFISNFISIALEALFNSKKLALRVTQKENLGNDINKVAMEVIKLIIIFIILWFFIVLFIEHLLKSFELQLLSKFQIPIYSKYFEIKYKQIEYLLSPLEILPAVFRFFILAIIIPFGIYSAYSLIIKTKNFSLFFFTSCSCFSTLFYMELDIGLCIFILVSN